MLNTYSTKSFFISKILAFSFAGLLVSGCLGLDDAGAKQTLGTLGGAVAGGVVGAQVGSGDGNLVAVGIGTLIGAAIGSEIGRSLDRTDQLYADRNAQESLEKAQTGETSGWENPDSGNSGTITPTKTYQTVENRYCREFEQTIYVGGEEQTGIGTACRNPDGTWTLVN